MGESADTAREKLASKRRSKVPARKPSADARAFGAKTAIFVPPELQNEGRKPVPKQSVVVTAKPKPETITEKKKREASETKAREDLRIGKRITTSTGKNRLDAVPVYRTPAQKHTLELLKRPPSAVTANAKTLRDWKRNLILSSSLSPEDKREQLGVVQEWYSTPGITPSEALSTAKEVGKAALSPLGKITHALSPSRLGVESVAKSGREYTPSQFSSDVEGITEAAVGKSLANVAFHGDLPSSAGEYAGLGVGLAGVLPVGRIPRAVASIRAAAKVAESERLYAKAAKDIAKNMSPEEIATSREAVQAQMDEHVAAVTELRSSEEMLTPAQVKEMKGHVDQIQNLYVHQQILDRAAGKGDTAFQGWSPKQTVARVHSKLNPANIAKGIAYKNPTVLNKAGIHVAGPVTPQQWVQKIIAAFPTVEERTHWATWYEHFAPAFREAFGDLADDLMRGFAVSQANNSPTGGMLATLRVLDRLSKGDTVESISHLGIGTKSLIKTIAKAVEGKDGKIDQGVAAKLSDFIDSFLQKDTRTWMGDHPLGGRPAAVDVHALRDVGLIDKKLVAKLEKVHGLKLGKDFVVDSQGAASGPLYERVSEKYGEFADHLNEIGFDGRSNWTPSEAQALGWGATQKTHGVDPEDLMSAFRGNTRQFNLELGASGYTPDEAAHVLDAVTPHVQQILDETANAFPEGTVVHGITGGRASLHFRVQSSPEVAQQIANRLSHVFGEGEVLAAKIGGSGAKPTLRIYGIPDGEAAAKVFENLRAAAPKRFKAGYQWVGGQMRIMMAGKQITVEAAPATHAELEPLISKAADASGVPQVEYDTVNLQILKGKSDGGSQVPGTRRAQAGRGVGVHSDARAREAYDTAVREVEDARTTQGIFNRLRDESGQLTVTAPGTRTLDDILDDYSIRSLTVGDRTQQLQGARSPITRALIERPAEAVSRSLEPGGALGRVGRWPLVFNASAMGRVVRHAGRELGIEAERARGAIRIHEKALPKSAESPRDVAHYWWAQLPEEYRNAEGLQLVRDAWNENYTALRDGSVLEGLQADLDEVEAAIAEFEAEQRLLPVAERKRPYELIEEHASIRRAITDIPVLLKTMPERISRLDAIIAKPPELDPKIINGLRGIAHDRESVLFETGVLKPEEAVNRKSLVSEWLGLEPDGNEIYMGHRMGKVRGARSGGLPAQYALGRPRAASGIGSQNRLVLVNNARARESTHVAIDDWLSAQTYKNGLRARQDLGSVGEVFDPATFDSATQVLVNPKSRSIPVAWKESGVDMLEQAVKHGYDEDLIRKAADDLVRSFESTPGDELSVQRVLAQARADGVDYAELRVVDKKVADRYYRQTSRPAKSGGGGQAYDAAVDFMVASIVFGRIGYIPKNFVQNLVMILPHQGVYATANIPRALDLLTASVRGDTDKAHLVYMILADVGQGASETLGKEFVAKAAGIPGDIAHGMSYAADAPGRISAFIHEAAARDIIPSLNPILSEDDVVALTRLFEERKYRPILNDVRSSSTEAMADFSRLNPVQRKWARRFLIVPGWLWAGTRYPVHFVATHPLRSAAIGYVAAGEPGAPDELKLNRPITDYMNDAKKPFLKGIKTPWGILRTGSISPISTPIELVHEALKGQVAGENLNPLAVALFHIARSEIEFPTGTVKAPFWEAVLSNLERLAPNWRLAKETTWDPNENSKYYPEDASRWGRFLRELGVVPIEVTDGEDGGELAPASGGGLMPRPGSSSGGGGLMPRPGSGGGSGSGGLMPRP